ncbi:MAG TPA: ABC transporter substrate-binding protein [Gammaproteobacteria bacterium]|nr:ABC transporter substrate-binding protein [Gammaproteobacteria bacterium]
MRWIVPFVLLLTAAFLPAAADTGQSPEALVHQTSQRMLAALSDNKAQIQQDPAKLYGLIKDIVLPHFDFQRMSRWALGLYWRRATPDQRRRFVDEFRTLLVRTYGKALEQYSDQSVEYLPLHRDSDARDVTVRTRVRQSGGPPIPINYSMEKTADGWKVYDVTVDGVSLVSNYRSTFSSQVRQQGLDGLIDMLAKRNRNAGA